MEAAPGFEPGVKVLQTSALPLGYAAQLWKLLNLSMERKTGFEPATLALARRCSTPEPRPLVRDSIYKHTLSDVFFQGGFLDWHRFPEPAPCSTLGNPEGQISKEPTGKKSSQQALGNLPQKYTDSGSNNHLRPLMDPRNRPRRIPMERQ